MKHAQETGQLEPVVSRSTRSGADVISGKGTENAKHWSMKAIHEGAQESHSLKVVDKEIDTMSDLIESGQDAHGVLVDLRAIKGNSELMSTAKSQAQNKVAEVNKKLTQQGLPKVELSFVEP